MQELNINTMTVEQYNLPDGANLILLVQASFTWDATLKGSDIKVDDDYSNCFSKALITYHFP